MGWKDKERKWRNGRALAAPLALSGFLYFGFLWKLYGSLSPFALYKGTILNPEYSVMQFFHFRIVEFFRCGLGYVFDQRVGLLVFSPIYLLVFGGLYLAWKNRDKKIRVALLLFGGYWAFCAMGYYWGGYCPPGRTLLPVLWIAALLLIGPVSLKDERIASIRRGLAALTLLITCLCLLNPRLLYHNQLALETSRSGIQSHLLLDLSNSFIHFPNWVPSLSYKQLFWWPALAIWILAAAAVTAAVVYWPKPKNVRGPQQALNRQIALTFCVLSLLIGYSLFDVHLQKGRLSGQETYRFLFQDGNTYGEEEGGFWVRGESSAKIIIATREKVKALRIRSSSPAPRETSLRVGSAKKRIIRKTSGVDSQVYASPVGFRWKGGFLYLIQIGEKGGFIPYHLDRQVQDNRHLGVFIKIELED
jgi:hypothetical protein